MKLSKKEDEYLNKLTRMLVDMVVKDITENNQGVKATSIFFKRPKTFKK